MAKDDDFETICKRHPTYNSKRLKKLADYAHGKVMDVGFNRNPNPYIFIDVGIDIFFKSKPDNYGRVYKVNAETFTDKVKDKFDTIIAGEIIEHLENPSSFLKECHKSLNDGGTLLITTPSPYWLPCMLLEMLNNRRFFFKDDHLSMFSPRIMFKLLKYNGFKLKKIEGSLFRYSLLYICEKDESKCDDIKRFYNGLKILRNRT